MHVCTEIDTIRHTQTCTVYAHEFRDAQCAALSFLNASPLLALQDIQPSMSLPPFVSAHARTHTFALSLSLVTAHLHI